MNHISSDDPTAVQVINRLADLASSLNADSRSAAEREVKEYQMNVDQQLGFVPLLLVVSVSGLASSPFASIVFKNTVKTGWDPNSAEHCIQDYDKTVIRSRIIQEMFRTVDFPVVQRNLGEAIAFIARIDFPNQWPDVLFSISQTLSAPCSVPSYSTALSTAHSILLRYRSQEEGSPQLTKELRNIYETFMIPFLGAMLALLETVKSSECAGGLRSKAYEGLIAGVECILDISQVDVGEEFLTNLEKIVHLFQDCLSLPVACAQAVELKSVVLSCVNHLLMYYDDDFENYAGQFVKVVWSMIVDPSSKDSSMDDLVVCGLELLSSACRGTTGPLFNTEEVLSMLLNEVALPNILLTNEEVELFELEPDMYIQRDVEGSDFHTRRRAASDIVRTLVLTFPDKARPLLLDATKGLFQAASTDWRAKDAAIFIASSLVLDGKRADAQRGAVKQHIGSIIPFETLVEGTILPELTTDISPTSPLIIKADCIRFVATFRAQLDHRIVPQLFPVLIQWLQCENRIVTSYAAHALDKLLQLTNLSTAVPGMREQRLVPPEELHPHAAALLGSLCLKIQEVGCTNSYHAQCLVHVLKHYPELTEPFVADIALSVNVALTEVIKNPTNPLFSHQLFDAISRCIALSKGDVAVLEGILLENIAHILANDVLEFVPYAFQIAAQLLDLHPAGSSPPSFYQNLLSPVMDPAVFSQKGNIPAAVRLLISYVERFPEFIHREGLTERLLNVVRLLVQLKNYDHEGLNLLTALLLSYPASAMDPYIVSVYQMLMQRLQPKVQTPKFVRIAILFLSVCVIVRGAADLVQRLETIQVGLFPMVMERIWLLNVQKITGMTERKLCLVALTQLLCNCPALHANAPLLAATMSRCWAIIHREVENDDHKSFTPTTHTTADLPVAREREFTNVFLALEAATHSPVDLCSDIADPVKYFRDQAYAFLNGEGSGLQSSIPPEALAFLMGR